MNHYPLDNSKGFGSTYPMETVIYPLDNAIHWINHYQLDNSINFDSTYSLGSDLSSTVAQFSSSKVNEAKLHQEKRLSHQFTQGFLRDK